MGTPSQVYPTPTTVGVAQTIGSPAMNLFAGRASTSGGTLTRLLRRETAVSCAEGQTASLHLRSGARLHLFGADVRRIGGAILNLTADKATWDFEEQV